MKSMKTKVILFSSKHRGGCFLCDCRSPVFPTEVWDVMILVLKDNENKKYSVHPTCTLYISIYMLQSNTADVLIPLWPLKQE